MDFIRNGGQLIQEMIDRAVADGSRAATVTGNYEIEKTIRIPSDFTLTLANCHLKMANDTFCNMFNNASLGADAGRTRAGADRNIIIEGVGRAILDGGEYNGLCEKNSGKDGRPHISVNNLLLFANVDGFRIRNLHLRNQRWWAMNFIFCRNGYIGNIDFCADDRWVSETGELIHYLGDPAFPDRSKFENGFTYQGVYIKNADGIDLRCGCHDITIENITGFTEDDTIALTGLPGKMEEKYGVEGMSTDIHNVIIRNVNASAFCSIVRLLNQSGIKLYNILVDGVMDASTDSPHMSRGINAVRIGDLHMYGTRHATEDETYNITVRNVYSRAEVGLRLAGAMKDCLFENIRTFDCGQIKIANDATVDVSKYLK